MYKMQDLIEYMMVLMVGSDWWRTTIGWFLLKANHAYQLVCHLTIDWLMNMMIKWKMICWCVLMNVHHFGHATSNSSTWFVFVWLLKNFSRPRLRIVQFDKLCVCAVDFIRIVNASRCENGICLNSTAKRAAAAASNELGIGIVVRIHSQTTQPKWMKGNFRYIEIIL